MPVLQTGRKHYSELIKGTGKFETESAVNHYFATVTVEATSDTDVNPVGTLLQWNPTDEVFNIITAASLTADEWAASTAVSVGDVYRPTTRNGFEYVVITAGTTNDTEGEPTWPTVSGATVTETDGVVWIARPSFSGEGSDLPNGSELCITVGPKEGKGFNKEDTTVTASGVQMTALFRGDAALVSSAVEFGSITATDQAEIIKQFEKMGISFQDEGTDVAPTFVS